MSVFHSLNQSVTLVVASKYICIIIIILFEPELELSLMLEALGAGLLPIFIFPMLMSIVRCSKLIQRDLLLCQSLHSLPLHPAGQSALFVFLHLLSSFISY